MWINNSELNKISVKLVGESLESTLDKAYCTVLFTRNYVIKLFCRNKREYDEKAIKNEYLWDKEMPFLSAKYIENVQINHSIISALILKRIPYSSNLLYGLIRGDLSKKEIVKIGQVIRKIVFNLPKVGITYEELYRNYMFNYNLQLNKLKDKIALELINQLKSIVSNNNILYLFNSVFRKEQPRLVHGNLFSGNIFYYQNEVILIDPISYNHIARKSFAHMDLATFLIDIRIFTQYNDFIYVYQKLTYNLTHFEKVLVDLYFILKLLVRLRFAYVENNLRDDYSKLSVNEMIIKKSEEILKGQIQIVLDEL